MEYEYNEYENSVEVCRHDLKLLMQVKHIKISLRERLELKLEKAKEEMSTFLLSTWPSIEELNRLTDSVNKDTELELEFNKKALIKVGEILDSAIRSGTKDAIQETYNLIQKWIDGK